MINVNEMTMGEMFGYMMAARGVTSNATTVEVVSALVDTTRQAAESVAIWLYHLYTTFVLGMVMNIWNV